MTKRSLKQERSESMKEQRRSNGSAEERSAPTPVRQMNSRGKLPPITKRKRSIVFEDEGEGEGEEQDLQPTTATGKRTKTQGTTTAPASSVTARQTESRSQLPHITKRRRRDTLEVDKDENEDSRNVTARRQTRPQCTNTTPETASSSQSGKRKRARAPLADDDDNNEEEDFKPATKSRKQRISQTIGNPSAPADSGKGTKRKRSDPLDDEDLEISITNKKRTRTYQLPSRAQEITPNRYAHPTPSSTPEMQNHSHSEAPAPSDDQQAVATQTKIPRYIDIHLPSYLVPPADFQIEIPRLQGIEKLQHSLNTDHPFPSITPIARKHWMKVSVELVPNSVIKDTTAPMVEVTVGHELTHLLDACEAKLRVKGLKRLWVRWVEGEGDPEGLLEKTEVSERNAAVLLHLIKVRGGRDFFECF